MRIKVHTIAAMALVPALVLTGPGLLPRTRSASSGRGGFLVVARSGDIDILDPAASVDPEGIHTLHELYSGLLGLDRNNNLVPDLAAALPAVSNEGRVYTFHLRPGLRFADGTPLTAADVVSSINRDANPSTGCWAVSELSSVAGYDAVEARKARTLSGVAALGKLTVRFTLTRPDAVFPYKMSMINFYVVEPSAVARWGKNFGKHVSGSGPFKFASYTPGQSLDITRNPYYYLHDAHGVQLPYLDKITWQLNVNDSVAVLKLESGDVDLLADGLPKESYAAVSTDSHFGPLVVREPSLEPFALAFNEGIKPFNNPLVRAAISMAVNRTRLIKLIGKYRVTPLDQWFPQGLNGYDPAYKGVSYDPTAAKALLARAGYAHGFSTTFLAGLWPDASADAVVGQAIQQDLAQIGIQLTVRTVTQSTALTLTAKPHTIPMWTTWWGPDFPEASDYLETLYRCGQVPPAGFNDIRYCNPRADSLLQQAESTSSPARRVALEQQVQRTILGNYAVFPLFQLNYVTIRPRRLANFYIHPNWQWDYAYYQLTR